MIWESLAGKRVAITGATGFLGTALVERLLRSVPDCEVVCIVRPTRKFSPIERIHREVVRNDCFDLMRQNLGDSFDSNIERRLSAIAGDVSSDALGLDEDGLAALSTCDIVIHSAATVSFDSPLDLAVEVNLLGPSRVAQAIKASGSNAHLIAVSTAYVAGNRRGEAFEELITDTWYSPDVDWQAEVTAGRRSLADAEHESRQVERLKEFGKKARKELGAAGTPLIAERTEKLRAEWVKERLVEQGKARAQSLGWPDVYAYTKALGERALLQGRGDIPVTFVRPSIIESAIEEPFPGWIRGFRMAEPILIGVGKGLLKSFPGLPEGILDVIPVDKVVATIIAVAAHGPDETPSVYQIASGTRQPLRYRNLVDLVTGWYRENPLYDADGQPIVVKEWDYPTRGKVQRELDNAIRGINLAERLLQQLPIRGAGAELSGRLEERRGLAERARGYVEIYGAYTASEARFRIDRTLSLYDALVEEDRRTFNFDPISIDWAHYLRDIHMPSIISQGRVRSKPVKKTTIDRAARGRKAVLSESRQMAAFDLENTLTRSNVAESYAWLATRHLSPLERARLIARKLPNGPSLLSLDRRDRGDFLRTFYRWYAGAPVDQLRQDGWDLFSKLILAKSFPAGLKRVREHRAAGHRTLLITGALDVVVEPLRPLFDDIVCSRMDEKNGKFTGELLEPPPVGEARALIIKDYAEKHGLQLAECVAYADSASDLPMLEAVGHPVAVNPETRLSAIARRRGWHVELWSKDGDTPITPLAPISGGAPGRAMKALVYERSVPRYVAANVVSRLAGGSAIAVSPVQLEDIETPKLPVGNWHVVKPILTGICGSDLDAVAGKSSRYFANMQTFPFVLGHEIVGRLADGTRVIVQPALGCIVRGIDPVCSSCAEGQPATCHNLAFGDIEPGLQTGFCASTGGGWSEQLVVHESQLHQVPESMSDEAAVIVEPTACAVHAVLSRSEVDGAHVAVIGAGTLGLLTVAALRHLKSPASVTIGAKHPHQRKLAQLLADGGEQGPHLSIVSPRQLGGAVRRRTDSLMMGSQLSGGADVVFDCVGSAASIAQALQIVRPRGRIVLVGMPGHVNVDLAALWNREVELVGAYCYGTQPSGRKDFEIAIELVNQADLGRLVTAKYPLARYRDAISHAADAGNRGAVKVVFDLTRRS